MKEQRRMNNKTIKMSGKIMIIILQIAGALCILYGAFVFMTAGWNVKFHAIWFVIGLLFFGAAQLLKQWYAGECALPKPLLIALCAIIVVGVICFVTVEFILISSALHKPEEPADYMVILGCQVNGTTISRALRYRLEEAVDFVEKQDAKDMKIIVSGGQGSGEDISEAEAMYRYLVKKRIPAGQIIKEEQSTNTVENIRYSKKLMKKAEPSVIVVSNGFHIFRATHICKKQGIVRVEGLGASSDIWMGAAYYLREFFAVLKDFLVGNLA